MADDNFSPTHIFWLTRARRYFPEAPDTPSGTKEDRALTVAHAFRRFSAVAVFSKREVFALAQEVYDSLEQEETEMLVHLNEVLVDGVEELADPTLFSQEVIVESQEKKNELLKRFLKKKRVAREDLEHFADPKLFLRKWLSEGFVGVMGKNGASLVWDFLYVHRFSRPMAVGVCLGLFHLLRPSLEQATDFKKAQNVFLHGPKGLLVRRGTRLFPTLDAASDCSSSRSATCVACSSTSPAVAPTRPSPARPRCPTS